MKYKEIIGDLIELSLSGSFDVIAQGCNCHNTQSAGIAPQNDNYYKNINLYNTIEKQVNEQYNCNDRKINFKIEL